MPNLPSSIAVFGPGLMGGSLLMALRQRAPGLRLGAWARRGEAITQLESRGLIDFGGVEAAGVAASAGMLVLCVPVERMEALARSIGESVVPDAVVTDVGSVKTGLVAGLESIFSGRGHFVGSHPMCGSEEGGLDAARADLYEGALCVVTPTSRSRGEAVCSVEALWKTVGARVVEMDPREHDRAAALVSHVPHLVAALLVELVRSGKPEFHALCAGGFRDTTRIASGSPDLWAGILSSNRPEVIAGLRGFENLAAEVRTLLERDNTAGLREFLAKAAAHRSRILAAS